MYKVGDRVNKTEDVPVGSVVTWNEGKEIAVVIVGKTEIDKCQLIRRPAYEGGCIGSPSAFTIKYLAPRTIKVGDVVSNKEFKEMPPGTVVYSADADHLLCRRKGVNAISGGPFVISSDCEHICDGKLWTSAEKLTVKYIPGEKNA